MTTIPVTGDTDWALSKNQSLADPRVNRMDAEAESRIYRTFRHFWHPVIYSDELDDTPKQVWLCDEQLVAVRLDGEANVFNDMCAHRGTALSLGKVVASDDGETLQCAYHGWRYARDGRCVLAPQRPDLAGRLRARIKRHNVVERYGMVWVCLADEPHFPLPEFPQFEDASYDCVAVPSTDWEHTFAVRRTENYIDPAHLAFVHDGYLGDSSNPAIPRHEVFPTARNVLHMRLSEPAREPAGAAKNKSIDNDNEHMEVMKTWECFMPLTVLLRSFNSAGETFCLFFHPTPMSPTTIRNFTIGARNFGSASTIFEEIAGWNKFVYEQDEPIVFSQRPAQLPEDLSMEMFLAEVDIFSLHYRKWLLELADELVPADDG